MSKNLVFSVSVIGCNADKFKENYGEYIQAYRDDLMDSKIFYLKSPSNIKDEISKLSEEGIKVMD